MRLERWEENKKEYTLNNGFSLKRAAKKQFGVYKAIYSGIDLELSYSWRIQTMVDTDDVFWILKDGKRVGGVEIMPNKMGSFFMETTEIVSRFEVIQAISEAHLQWSDGDELRVYGVLTEDVPHFEKLGYEMRHSRKVMIRPTEEFENMEWGDDLSIRTPFEADVEMMGKLFQECYKGGADYAAFGEQDEKEAIESAQYVMNVYKENGSLDGSVVVFDHKTSELIGVCLAGKNGFCDNEFSEIGELAVKPEYQRRSIASNMVKYALNNLFKTSPATILCVTGGNTAEKLYRELGFYPGVEFTCMHICKEK